MWPFVGVASLGFEHPKYTTTRGPFASQANRSDRFFSQIEANRSLEGRAARPKSSIIRQFGQERKSLLDRLQESSRLIGTLEAELRLLEGPVKHERGAVAVNRAQPVVTGDSLEVPGETSAGREADSSPTPADE